MEGEAKIRELLFLALPKSAAYEGHEAVQHSRLLPNNCAPPGHSTAGGGI